MKRFADMVGNAELVDLLRRAQLPPSSLLVGPEGVGKKTAAVLLGALANCHQPVGRDVCGLCPSCIKVASGNHPDVVVVHQPWLETVLASKGKQYNPRVITVDATREIIREAQYRPYEGKLRFFIIDDAHKLNEAAANSLLKTLEEPPETTRLVLVTAHPGQLLPTILSRCQVFRFRALEREQVRKLLSASYEAATCELAAAFSQGSIGRALALNLDVLTSDRDAVLGLLSDWLRWRSFSRLYSSLEKPPLASEMKNRERVLALLDMLETVCLDVYYIAVGTAERVVNLDRTRELEALAQGVGVEWVREFLGKVREARRDIEHYLNPLICFETMWLQERILHVGDRNRPV